MTGAWRTIARVNSQDFGPGDQVLFKAGATFAGTIYFEPAESGTPAAPIAVGSYGRTGRATIDGGTGAALFAYNAGGFSIANLTFKGSGSGTNHSGGISFYNDLAGDVSLRYLHIRNVDVSGFEDGVLIGGYNDGSGYEDIQITSSSLHDNRDSGLNIYGPPFDAAAPIYVNSAVSVSDVTAFDNLGDPDNLTKNSGNGIVFGSVIDGTIDHSSAYGNGSRCRAPEGPSGILVYDSTDVTVEHNETYSNHRDGPADGNGIDLDQNVSNSTVQYNYSHDNDGPGLLLYTGQNNSAHVGNTVRYNISEDDSRRGGHGGIQLGGRIYGAAIYQNTVYTSPSGAGTPKPLRVLSVGSGVVVRNNILFASGPLPTLSSPVLDVGTLLLQGNDYYGDSGLKIRWGGRTFTNLAAWRTATGEEKLLGEPTGLEVDPKLVNPGGGGTIGDPDQLAHLTAYKLQNGSPMIDDALNLATLFGIDPGGRDFYGVTLFEGLGPDIGASES